MILTRQFCKIYSKVHISRSSHKAQIELVDVLPRGRIKILLLLKMYVADERHNIINVSKSHMILTIDEKECPNKQTCWTQGLPFFIHFFIYITVVTNSPSMV